MKDDFKTMEDFLPEFLKNSIHAYLKGESEKVRYLDCLWSELNSDINVAEVGGEITADMAYFLRGEYLFDYEAGN